MLHERTTPNGTTIYFEDGLPDPETGKSKRRTYWLGEKSTDTKVPSITTVLGVMEKDGLHYAIEKLAVSAAIELAKDGGLPLDLDEALGIIKGRELSFQQQWRAKASKGTDIHDYFERLLVEGEGGIPTECEAFAQAILAWREVYAPQVLQSEVMVCSTRHRVAGRFDCLATIPQLEADVRIELKSMALISRRPSGEVYPPYTEHLWQLAGQEMCALESGDPPSQLQAVLRVDEEGAYDFHVTQVEPRGFIAALRLWRALRGIPEPGDRPAQTTLEEAA